MLLPSIQTAVDTLSRGSEGIAAVLNMANNEENRFTLALADLQRMAQAHDIPIAIVGGLGAIRYGYPAATQDIDVGIGKDKLDEIIRVSKLYGFVVAWESKKGWHTLMHGDVEINIVPEGGKANDQSPTTIPGPCQMGVIAGLHYAKLESWVELKVSSNRQKDRAHVVEVLKKTDRPMIQKIQSHLENVHPLYANTFKQLISQANEESEQESQRR